MKKWNLNTKNPITFNSFAKRGYGPINYNWGQMKVGELEELIINVEAFNNTKLIPCKNGTKQKAFSRTHIKKLIILDESTTHKLEVTNTDRYGLFDSQSPGIESSGIENVIVDDGITELGKESLVHLDIKSITLPNTLTTIGDVALSSNKLTSITIPSSVKTIGSSAFGSNQLTSITIPSSVETIGAGAFANNQLTSITIPSSIETIGSDAFRKNQITTINFESNSKLKTIGIRAFAVNKLTNTGLGKLPSSLTSLDTDAFSDNPDLTQITLTSPKDLPGWPNGGTVNGRTVTYER